MARNVDGEFEVLLGNKHLLSVFFIVVVLLGVFFTMGYMLGRHSVSGGGYAELPSRRTPPTAPAQSSDFAEAPPPDSTQQAGAASAAPAAEEPPAKTGTQPQQQLPTAETRKPAVAARPAAQEPAVPAEGQVYLQTAAAKRPDAQVVAGVLKQRGFPVVIAPGPTDAVVRVLVGPLSNAQAVAKARRDLETIGIKSFIKKY
jgi:cell division protein FtsN